MDSSLVITFAVGLVASIISGIAGGGAGFILIPFLIILGLDPKIAAATTTLGAIGLGIGTLSRFFRSREYIWRHVAPFTIISLASGVGGAYLLILIPTEYVSLVVGLIILLFLPLFLLKRDAGIQQRDPSRIRNVSGYLLYRALGL